MKLIEGPQDEKDWLDLTKTNKATTMQSAKLVIVFAMGVRRGCVFLGRVIELRLNEYFHCLYDIFFPFILSFHLFVIYYMFSFKN